jgi:hypothetical protein
VAVVEETPDKLVRNCVAAVREQADFPTVWQTVLKGHPLVIGPPIQSFESGRACLKIPLITRQWLVFDSTSKEFSLIGR